MPPLPGSSPQDMADEVGESRVSSVSGATGLSLKFGLDDGIKRKLMLLL